MSENEQTVEIEHGLAVNPKHVVFVRMLRDIDGNPTQKCLVKMVTNQEFVVDNSYKVVSLRLGKTYERP